MRDEQLAQEDLPGADLQDIDPAVPEDRRGTPPGMDGEDVEVRSEIAQALGRHVYPAGRDDLVQTAVDNEARDVVIDRLRSLPADQEFQNVQEVAEALGLGTESQRF